MNICFITCFNKTIFFKKISDTLEKQNPQITTYWISTSPKWSQYLVDNGTDPAKIVQINADEQLLQHENDQAKELLSSAELKNNKSGNFIFLTDRIIKHWNHNKAENYLLLATKKIHDALKNNHIKIVFGEATAFHEVLTAFLCEANAIEFLKPHTIRIPTTHFAFFKGYLENQFASEDTPPSSTDFEKAKQQIISVTEKNQKPDYFYINNKRPSYFDKKFLSTVIKKIPESYKEPIKNASEKSIYHHLFIEQKFLTPLKSLITSKVNQFEEPIDGEKFILFTLHKQPEASIDVLGTAHSNQIELIRSISLNTPRDYKIYVKEHSNAVGERSLNYLSDIKKIPNVRLINPSFDSHKLIKASELVLTISGTIAFEAALYGKKSATFAPMFFNKISNCYHIKSAESIPKILSEKLIDNSESNISSSLASIISNSYTGSISDPVSSPNCISEENMNSVSSAFLACIKKYE
jgi:hypothetical protein